MATVVNGVPLPLTNISCPKCGAVPIIIYQLGKHGVFCSYDCNVFPAFSLNLEETFLKYMEWFRGVENEN